MRFLFFQALLELARHDYFLLRNDFAALHTKVHLLPVANRRVQLDASQQICRSVAEACTWYPKESLCLQRSSVAVILLRRYGIPAEMVIGAQRSPLRAHAWVEVEGRVINDRPEVQAAYLVVDRC
jgi:hypothetical protein